LKTYSYFSQVGQQMLSALSWRPFSLVTRQWVTSMAGSSLTTYVAEYQMLHATLRLDVARSQVHRSGGTVSALISLARCLPGDTELGGNLRPADAEVDGLVDERIDLCLRSVFQSLSAIEPL
jgi:hypothetical protein